MPNYQRHPYVNLEALLIDILFVIYSYVPFYYYTFVNSLLNK